jgi:hypothetical protein
MPIDSTANLVKVLLAKKVLTNASTNSNLVNKLPEPFYYKSADFSSYNDYRINLEQYQNINEGSCFLAIQTIPLYDQLTNNKIGTVTFHDYLTKSVASDPAVVSEKLIFNFNSTDNSSIIAEYSFLSDDITIYPADIINQRIISGTGSYLNLYGYNLEVVKKADDNYYISIVHN